MGISIKLPTEKVVLPSNGFGYNEEIPKTLTLKMLTLSDSKAMMAAGSSLTNMISNILKNCIEEPIDVDKLYATDRLFLFYMLRKLSFGAKIDMEYTCDACGHKNAVVKMIPDDFSLKVKTEDSFTKTITLSITKLKVTVKLLTGAEEALLERRSVQDKKGAIIDRIACHIVKIEQGKEVEENAFEIKRIAQSLPLAEQVEIKDALDSIDFGLMTTHVLTCEACQAEQEVPLAIGQSFFRRG